MKKSERTNSTNYIAMTLPTQVERWPFGTVKRQCKNIKDFIIKANKGSMKKNHKVKAEVQCIVIYSPGV